MNPEIRENTKTTILIIEEIDHANTKSSSFLSDVEHILCSRNNIKNK